MENVRIPFASVVVALLCCVPMWSQTATLSGYVLDKKDNQPINGARVSIVNSTKLVLSNSDGKYTISGLARGNKVSVTYVADGYGTPPPDEVPLDKDPTEHTVHL
jgi:Carboxypeptidase regulatory-like domain